VEELFKVEQDLASRLGPRPKTGISSIKWLRDRFATLCSQHPGQRALIAAAINDLRIVAAYEERSWETLESSLLMLLASQRRPKLRDSLYMEAAECFEHTRSERLNVLLRGVGLRYMKARAPAPMLLRYRRILGMGAD
jgi:hypothetical protein